MKPIKEEEMKYTKLAANTEYGESECFNPLNKAITENNLRKAQDVKFQHKDEKGNYVYAKPNNSKAGKPGKKYSHEDEKGNYVYKDIDESLPRALKNRGKEHSDAGISFAGAIDAKSPKGAHREGRVAAHQFGKTLANFRASGAWRGGGEEGLKESGEHAKNIARESLKGKKEKVVAQRKAARETEKFEDINDNIVIPIITDKGIILVPDNDIDNNLPRHLKNKIKGTPGNRESAIFHGARAAGTSNKRSEIYSGGKIASHLIGRQEAKWGEHGDNIEEAKQNKGIAKLAGNRKTSSKEIKNKQREYTEYDIPVITKRGIVLVDKDSIVKGASK